MMTTTMKEMEEIRESLVIIEELSALKSAPTRLYIDRNLWLQLVSDIHMITDPKVTMSQIYGMQVFILESQNRYLEVCLCDQPDQCLHRIEYLMSYRPDLQAPPIFPDEGQ